MTVSLGIEGRHALVTAGTTQTGSGCVERLCQEGVAVAFTGEDRERGRSLAAQAGATFLQCDPTDRAACDRAVARALEAAGGRLDVLVTNGALLVDGPLEATSEAALRELLEANLTAVFRAGRACLGSMREHGGGSMIHIASTAGVRAVHENAAYSVACAGVIAVAELLAAEGARHSVRSNAVCPDPTGVDVAPLVAWLASDESAHVSGATLRVDRAAGAAMVIDTRT